VPRDLNRFVLGSSALGVAAIGAIYLIAPQAFLDIYEIDLRSASETNLYRAAYGGLFLGFAGLFGLGASRGDLAKPAQIGLLTFMGGAAVGRLVSMIVDGWPHPLIVAVFGVELAYFCAATFLLRDGATVA
jgi:hypothetical protein